MSAGIAPGKAGRVGGRAFVFGDDVDTDVIVPGRYLRGNIEDIVPHVMEGIRPTFVDEVRPGDVVVAGRNFGTGSSRELAVVALQRAGIAAMIAVSFARIFFRNCINNGMLAVECAEAGLIKEGDHVQLDTTTGIATVQETGAALAFVPIPSEIAEILACGGLEGYLAQKGRRGR